MKEMIDLTEFLFRANKSYCVKQTFVRSTKRFASTEFLSQGFSRLVFFSRPEIFGDYLKMMDLLRPLT